MAVGLGSIVSDARCDALISESSKNWEMQKNFRFPSNAFLVELMEFTPNSETQIPRTKDCIIVTDGTNGLLATFVHGSSGEAGNLLVQMTNERYYAMVTRGLAPNESSVTKLDHFTSGFRNAGFSGLVEQEIWIDRAVRAGISGGFLASSEFDFSRYVSAWRSGKATLECTISDNSDQPHRLRFENFTGAQFPDIASCTFGIDPHSLLVSDIEHYSKTLHCRFGVGSFIEVEGVKLPGKVTLTHFDSGTPSFKVTINSKVLHPDSVGFDRRQLYLSWYGLAEPSTEVVAAVKRSSGYLYIFIGGILAVVSAFLFWRKHT